MSSLTYNRFLINKMTLYIPSIKIYVELQVNNNDEVKKKEKNILNEREED